MTQFLKSFRWLLAGYAIFGRSFAYLGYPPLFIGEIFLGWGILRAPWGRSLGRLFTVPAFILLFLFMFYCSLLTVIGATHAKAVDALRDGVIWGYGAFAIIVAAYCLRNSEVIIQSLESYRRFALLYIFLAPAMAILNGYLRDRLPMLPGTTIPILTEKASDVQVHLAGVAAFAYLGFRRFSNFQMMVLFVGVLAMATISRGGFVAFIAAFAVLTALKPQFKFIVTTIGILIITISLFTFFDFELQLFGREISTVQLGHNILSIFGLYVDPYDLGGTRQWRIDWWNQIISYTFHGDHFWFGKGFGINLADDDGIIDITSDLGEPLRSPHSAHMTFLARGGVPLFFFWIILQAAWAFGILRVIFRSRSKGHALQEKIAIFVLTYWAAMLANMSFDVYLEGPMGGIWFWTIWGYGLAVMWLYRYAPQALLEISAVPHVTQDTFSSQPAE